MCAGASHTHPYNHHPCTGNPSFSTSSFSGLIFQLDVFKKVCHHFFMLFSFMPSLHYCINICPPPPRPHYVALLPPPCTGNPPASLDQPIPVPISSRDWRFGHYKRAPHSVMAVRSLQLLRCWASDAVVVADWLYGYVSGIVLGKPHIEPLAPNKSVDEL